MHLLQHITLAEYVFLYYQKQSEQGFCFKYHMYFDDALFVFVSGRSKYNDISLYSIHISF